MSDDTTHVVARFGSELVVSRVRRVLQPAEGFPEEWGPVLTLSSGGIIKKSEAKTVTRAQFKKLAKLTQEELQERIVVVAQDVWMWIKELAFFDRSDRDLPPPGD